MDRTETITIGDVCEIICKHCVKAHGACRHHWDCPLLTEIAKFTARKDEPQTEFIACPIHEDDAWLYEDEPQTETEVVRTIIHKIIDNTDIAEDAYPGLRQRLHDAVDEYEPQTADVCTWDGKVGEIEIHEQTDCPWK